MKPIYALNQNQFYAAALAVIAHRVIQTVIHAHRAALLRLVARASMGLARKL